MTMPFRQKIRYGAALMPVMDKEYKKVTDKETGTIKTVEDITSLPPPEKFSFKNMLDAHVPMDEVRSEIMCIETPNEPTDEE